MTMELASTRIVRKPWGSTDLRPWSEIGHDGNPIGELWFERSDRSAAAPALLIKLLFTEEPLSIQVHPDNDFAQSIGLATGKTEAWYVLSATATAQIALGLKRELSRPSLRMAIESGSIAELVKWQDVHADDAIFVPAGTIHAIGAGLVIAEIQQRSDATFRMFDYGRKRDLHLDAAVGAATAGPAGAPMPAKLLSDARTLLAGSPYFMLERLDLAPNSRWEVGARQETWILLLEGDAKFDLMHVSVGEAVLLDDQSASLRVGAIGAKALLAYAAAEPALDLLHSLDGQGSTAHVPDRSAITPAEPVHGWAVRS
jgi:mannose-6-phosphate isomerase